MRSIGKCYHIAKISCSVHGVCARESSSFVSKLIYKLRLLAAIRTLNFASCSLQVQGHMECISLHSEVRRGTGFMERMGTELPASSHCMFRRYVYVSYKHINKYKKQLNKLKKQVGMVGLKS